MNQHVMIGFITALGGTIVAVASAVALKNDWNAHGLDNAVFKVMLALLCIGAVIAVFAGIHA